jgi:hypothetical protein
MRKRLISIVASGLFLMSSTAFPASSFAADGPNILIMGEDAGGDTVPRDSEAFRSVLDALSNQLLDEGFNAVDEGAVTLKSLAKGGGPRSDAQVIDAARSVEDPPIDVAVVFSIDTSVKHAFYNTRVIARIPGRLLNVKTGERLGDFQVQLPKHKTDRDWFVLLGCRHECVFELVGKNAEIVAENLGAALAERLTVTSAEKPE